MYQLCSFFPFWRGRGRSSPFFISLRVACWLSYHSCLGLFVWIDSFPLAHVTFIVGFPLGFFSILCIVAGSLHFELQQVMVHLIDDDCLPILSICSLPVLPSRHCLHPTFSSAHYTTPHQFSTLHNSSAWQGAQAFKSVPHMVCGDSDVSLSAHFSFLQRWKRMASPCLTEAKLSAV